MVASDKSWKRFKTDLKATTRKTAPYSFDERIRKLKEVQRGWVNYFRMASIHGKLKDLDGWVRNRLRYCIWHDWKKPERRRKSLIRLGIKPKQARSWSRTRMGGWTTAQSPILVTTITIKRLMKRGYQSALDLYMKISPQFNEPLITRPVRSGNVGGLPRPCPLRTVREGFPSYGSSTLKTALAVRSSNASGIIAEI